MLLRPTALSLLAPLACALIFTGCGAKGADGDGSDAEQGDEADLVAAAKPVPAAVAQALTLRERITSGMTRETAQGVHFAQLLAQDFRGQNAVYLTFTSPEPIGDVWAYALSLDPSSWESESTGSAWTTTIAGATTVHAPITLSAVGLGLLVKLGRAAEAAGGSGQVKAILAATPTRFFVEDVSGNLWDVETGEIADEQTLSDLQVEHKKTVASLSKQSLVKDMRQKWAPAMVDQAAGAKPTGRTMKDFVGDDGMLDVARAVDQLDQDGAFEALKPQVDGGEDFSPDAFSPADGPGQTPLAQKQTKTCKRVMWWDECTTVQEGAFSTPAKQQAHRAIQNKKYTVPSCTPGGAMASNTWQGCAPAAVVALLWRPWAAGTPLKGLPAYDGGAYNASSYGPKSLDLQASQELAQHMGSCRIGDSGTMTLPWKVVPGANDFLAAHGSALRLKSSTSTLLGNTASAEDKARVLRDRVGKEKGPVAALIQLSATGYHYTPVDRFRIVYPPSGPVEVYVVGFDEGQSTKAWYALHDPWTVATGLYWLE